MKVATQVLRYALAIAQSDLGATAILSLGGPVAALLLKFGTMGLTSALSDWDKPEITDAEVEASLKTKGFRVVPFDPKTLWGA